MGLGFHVGGDHNKCTASWSYGGFNDFRRRVAASIGIDLDQMVGYHKSSFDSMRGVLPGNPRPWSTVDDPICVLLNHSDCDGSIAASDAGPLADRLEEIVTKWDAGCFDYDKDRALRLVDGLRVAAREGKPLEFC